MATHNSTYYKTPSVARTAVADNLEPAQSGGIARVFYAKVTASAQTLAENDLANLFDLPIGAIPIMRRLKWGAFGASVTLDLGWSGDVDALEDGLDVSSAGTQEWTAVDDGAPLAAAKTVQAKFLGANPADDQNLEVWLLAAVSL